MPEKNSNVPIKILLVEDGLVDAKLYESFLKKDRRNRYAIVHKKTGRDALKALKQFKPHCILLDYQLPDMDGVRFMKSLDKGSEFPIVMITGQGNEYIAISAIQGGAQEYLKKGSFGAYDLAFHIQKAIEKVHMSKKINEQQNDLEKRANFDSLTGIYNRSAFLKHLKKIFEIEIESLYQKVAVIFIDLDRFKFINDTYGHEIGDKYLVEIVSRIQMCIRPKDVFARIGGDELTICLAEPCDESASIMISKRIQERLKPSFAIEGHILYPGVSIGIAVTSERHRSPEKLLQDADTAMYESKKQGGSCFTLFSEAIQKKYESKWEIENELKKAINNMELEVHYQPIISLQTNKTEGVEALIRWWHQDKKSFIPPSEFIPIAEKSCLIEKIGQFVLNEACRKIKTLHSDGFPIFLSFNLSPKELEHPEAIGNIIKIVRKHQISPQLLRAEVTESCFMHKPKEMLRKMELLAEHHVGLSLDDFGSGYSSMSYLKKFPFQCVKIDRSLTKGIVDKESDIRLMSGIISMLHDLHLEVVVEGVENKQQFQLLEKLKPEYLQGYLFGKPMFFKDLKLKLDQQGTRKRPFIEIDSPEQPVKTKKSVLWYRTEYAPHLLRVSD